MTTKLYRIRHGESVGNVEPIIGGPRGDRGLTDRGREQARLLEQRLRAERPHAHRLHTSTLPRARDTADYVARALRLPAQPTDDSTNCALARPTASRWTNGAHATPCDPQLG
jgi:broad specificity phosphatase PhoE